MYILIYLLLLLLGKIINYNIKIIFILINNKTILWHFFRKHFCLSLEVKQFQVLKGHQDLGQLRASRLIAKLFKYLKNKITNLIKYYKKPLAIVKAGL